MNSGEYWSMWDNGEAMLELDGKVWLQLYKNDDDKG